MQIDHLPIGNKAPYELNTIIEDPKGSFNKYKFSESRYVFRYDRTLYSPLYYPADYGWICGTKEIGRTKPLNILVMSTNPTFTGCLVVARPIGALLMNHPTGPDNKVLAVAVADPRFVDIKSIKDLSDHYLLEIRHFFEMYQVLEEHSVSVGGWIDADDTLDMIRDAANLPIPAE